MFSWSFFYHLHSQIKLHEGYTEQKEVVNEYIISRQQNIICLELSFMELIS
jgi:hypothetical protein